MRTLQVKINSIHSLLFPFAEMYLSFLNVIYMQASPGLKSDFIVSVLKSCSNFNAYELIIGNQAFLFNRTFLSPKAEIIFEFIPIPSTNPGSFHYSINKTFDTRGHLLQIIASSRFMSGPLGCELMLNVFFDYTEVADFRSVRCNGARALTGNYPFIHFGKFQIAFCFPLVIEIVKHSVLLYENLLAKNIWPSENKPCKQYGKLPDIIKKKKEIAFDLELIAGARNIVWSNEIKVDGINYLIQYCEYPGFTYSNYGKTNSRSNIDGFESSILLKKYLPGNKLTTLKVSNDRGFKEFLILKCNV